MTLTAFWMIGAAGVFVLVLSLIFDDFLDIGDGDGFSVPAAATAAATFGFAGGAAASVAGAPIGVAVGAAVSVPMAVVVVRFARAMMHMPTDPTPTMDDWIGCPGKVVTAIGESHDGEVLVQSNGHTSKLTAASVDGPMPAGSRVVVISAQSATHVTVAAFDV